MLLLSPQLGLPITSHARDGASHGTGDAVGDAGAEVAELALGFLGLALGVLLAAGALQIL